MQVNLKGKLAIDGTAIGITASWWIDLLPSIATAFTIIWLALRIWEMETVRRLMIRTLRWGRKND